MSTIRDRPYSQFNFQVHLGSENPEQPDAAFQEIGGLDEETAHPRSREDRPTKIPGSHKVGDVTFKRGVIGDLALQQWLQQAKNAAPNARRDVTIIERNQNHEPVRTWRLLRAIPMKYAGPTLAGKGGGDVAVEELVLAVEEIELV